MFYSRRSPFWSFCIFFFQKRQFAFFCFFWTRAFFLRGDFFASSNRQFLVGRYRLHFDQPCPVNPQPPVPPCLPSIAPPPRGPCWWWETLPPRATLCPSRCAGSGLCKGTLAQMSLPMLGYPVIAHFLLYGLSDHPPRGPRRPEAKPARGGRALSLDKRAGGTGGKSKSCASSTVGKFVGFRPSVVHPSRVSC